MILALWWTVNWVYQVARKPSELFFPVSRALNKAPAETWRQYGSLFRAHSTAVVTPGLLAALAQAEGAGNPVARTYWRWQLSLNPFELYRPASSAVGMFQITDGTFQEARRYCIHDHRVVEDGAWHDFRSCWFNALYMRVVPSHAVELTAAHLDRSVARTLERRKIATATLAPEAGAGRPDPPLRRRRGRSLCAPRVPGWRRASAAATTKRAGTSPRSTR